MTAWMPVLVPLLAMFALGMERVESRLRPSEPGWVAHKELLVRGWQ